MSGCGGPQPPIPNSAHKGALRGLGQSAWSGWSWLHRSPRTPRCNRRPVPRRGSAALAVISSAILLAGHQRAPCPLRPHPGEAGAVLHRQGGAHFLTVDRLNREGGSGAHHKTWIRVAP